MLEAVLHAASLVAFGQSMGEGRAEDPLKGLAERSPFASVSQCAFIRASKAYGGGSIASLPAQFLRRLAKEDVVSIRLVLPALNATLARSLPQGERNSLALVTEGGAGIEVWTPEWSLKSRTADVTTWNVEYVATRGSRQWGSIGPGAAEIEARLFQAIERLVEACAAAGQAQWAKRLGALQTMRTQRWSASDRFGDALPSDWPAAERQLLGNVVRAWTMLASEDFAAQDLSQAEASALQAVWDAMRVAIETGVNLPAQSAARRAA